MDRDIVMSMDEQGADAVGDERAMPFIATADVPVAPSLSREQPRDETAGDDRAMPDIAFADDPADLDQPLEPRRSEAPPSKPAADNVWRQHEVTLLAHIENAN